MNLLGNFLDLLFPPRCVHCLAYTTGAAMCPQCFASIKISETLFCGKCRARLPEQKKICHLDFPYLLGAAADYKDEAARDLVHNLKFKFITSAAAPLSDLLMRYAQSLALPLQDFSVIPIPLSKQRERTRGFNQSRLIAEPFARHFNIPILENALIRAKHAKPQSELEHFEERFANIEKSFMVKNPDALTGKNIILIDDVTTSGATFLEAASVLKSAGARKIIALAAAKA